jgi:hypothetical protein
MKLRLLIKLSVFFILSPLLVCVRDSFAQTCTDSDGGLDYYQSGEVTTSTDVFYDRCDSYTSVQEYYCDELASNSEIYNCSNQGEGRCFNSECCNWVGESCTTDNDCCSNYSCQAGTCVSPEVILNEGNGSCVNYCMESGYSGCASVGTDSSGLNGLISLMAALQHFTALITLVMDIIMIGHTVGAIQEIILHLYQR